MVTMVKTVNLDENEHAVTVLRGLEQMKNEQDLCDFIIKVGDVEYPTHKNILSVGSPYFKAMLRHDTKESRDGKVEMKDVDPVCVKSCIDFLYSGSFDIPDGKIGQLLHIAILWQLDKVKKSISNTLSTSLNAANFYETRDIAKMYDLPTISRSCKIYYKENFMAIALQPGFQNEEKSDLISILNSKHLKFSEEEKLTVSLRWVGENPLKKENLFGLIKLINLKDVSSEYLSDILNDDTVISNDLRLYKLITAYHIEKSQAVKNTNRKDSYRNQIVLFDDDADCLLSYDPATNEVTKYHNEKFKHLTPFTAVSMDSYIYVLCGNKSVHRINFRDKNSKWETMQRMIVDRGNFPLVVPLSGSLFVIGSRIEGTREDVENFDPTANRWSRMNDKLEKIDGATLVPLNDSIFCIGGWYDGKALNSFGRFTPSLSEWVELEPMKNARVWCGAVAVEQRIFVMGGFRDMKILNEVECYDLNSKQWTSLKRMINRHAFNIAYHIDGWIFSIERRKGLDPKIQTKHKHKAERYDIANNRWYKVEFKEVVQLRIYDSVSIGM